MVTREVVVVERVFLKWTDVFRLGDKEALLIVIRFIWKSGDEMRLRIANCECELRIANCEF